MLELHQGKNTIYLCGYKKERFISNLDCALCFFHASIQLVDLERYFAFILNKSEKFNWNQLDDYWP